MQVQPPQNQILYICLQMYLLQLLVKFDQKYTILGPNIGGSMIYLFFPYYGLFFLSMVIKSLSLYLKLQSKKTPSYTHAHITELYMSNAPALYFVISQSIVLLNFIWSHSIVSENIRLMFDIFQEEYIGG